MLNRFFFVLFTLLFRTLFYISYFAFLYTPFCSNLLTYYRCCQLLFGLQSFHMCCEKV